MTHPLRDCRSPRDWARPWRDPPGMICCCVPGSSQSYFTMGGEKQGTPNVIVSTNFNWAGGAWSTKAALAVTKENMGRATPTAPNPAYVYGGDSATTPFFLSRADNYVPDTWSTDTAMSDDRQGQASVPISGKCYSWGGKKTLSTWKSENFQMTPGSPSTWATKAAVTTALYEACASYISAKGYNIAGVTSAPADTRTNYEYDPSGDSWTTKTQTPTAARSGAGAFTISGTIYVIGGGGGANVNDSYVVDSWTSLGGSPPMINHPNNQQYPGAASIDPSGVGWVTGGLQNTGNLLQSHDEYVPPNWTNRTNVTTTLQWNASTPA